MEIDLAGDAMTIGRATANASWEISLQDRAVSRPHARLEPVPDADTETWRIVDLGSANGTLVNGAPVDGEAGHILRDGDVMTIGETMLLFRMD
jgi:pSer/pThr/pTyr-binding forkhead associated (FHA) protein